VYVCELVFVCVSLFVLCVCVCVCVCDVCMLLGEGFRELQGLKKELYLNSLSAVEMLKFNCFPFKRRPDLCREGK